MKHFPIDELFVEKTPNLEEYKMSGRCNAIAIPQHQLDGDLSPENKDIMFDTTGVSNTNELTFMDEIIVFDESYGRNDMLRVMFDKCEMAGVCIRDTNYPPPRGKQITKLMTQTSFTGLFIIDSLKCTRKSTGNRSFNINIGLSLHNSPINYEQAGTELIYDNLNEVDVLVLLVKESSMTVPDLDFNIDIMLGNYRDRGLSVIVTADDKDSINWAGIDTKKALFFVA